MESLAKFPLETLVSTIIGPQIGPIFESCGVKITIALPNENHEQLTCILYDTNNNEIDKKASKHLNPHFKNYVFIFDALEAGKKYRYKFFEENQQEIQLDGGLKYSDCWFFAPVFNEGDRFVLLSCNNPYESKKEGAEQFRMWERLHDEVMGNSTIKLVIQGGDQLYNDDIEADCLDQLKTSLENKEGVYQNLIRNYQIYFGNLHYRKIMASIPSVAMLDDHDITDGWGGRPSSFDKEAFKPEWASYFEIAYEAFLEYQAIKNPDVRLHENAATTFLDFGKNRLYLLDLRKEKNINNKEAPLLSDAHSKSIFDSLNATPKEIENIFVLCPVVPVRINPLMEDELSTLAKFAYELRDLSKQKLRAAASMSSNAKFWWSFIHWLSGLGGIADLTDDLTDGLSAKVNRKFLLALLDNLGLASSQKNKTAYILSGDIHTGGISEIFVKHDEYTACIPQIVSSPIGYLPMKKLAKDKTTEEIEYTISLEEAPNENVEKLDVSARNIFYRADRNFVIFTPASTPLKSKVEFTFEGLSAPIISAASFWEKPNNAA